jgi:hypothetical protein
LWNDQLLSKNVMVRGRFFISGEIAAIFELDASDAPGQRQYC